MAVTLGKRKRRKVSTDEIEQGELNDRDARALFQRAFEAKFTPLEVTEKLPSAPETAPLGASFDEDDEESVSSDWNGLSDDWAQVEVVKHDTMDAAGHQLAKQEQKAFMSSKPPTATSRGPTIANQGTSTSAEDEAESSNLKHDLALQRLLKESHLLDHASTKDTAIVPEGKVRVKAVDLRLRELGAKGSVLEQKTMPLAHRKGINAKAAGRETARRKEAVENGVILEKVRTSAQPQKRRERGIGAPSIGKFRGGTLKLSSHDVKSIERSRLQGGSKGRRR
ncbi:pre-rRNA processing and 40S ribosomal subunit assembly [Friedmanniomyces endolithicus]|uniref:Pre-rRNA processing and 40S ribosomal subunit assembly n=1 Tax=Friedmanniomyces endolithicus TaxID=329885 RepID=A0A4U0UI25_9PEZI|nr:pre-rRNA processing and 40S ribosomal subunit assembly [Friedmanniomyces endolithicus]KAK0291765.1 pre-rRNA processing and 40S ribosomal subunit assembly [Friedmanniomyces endolithicus]KAK0296561.1 pre-rRNA processing and 40S ribosomal subunit assembly [Friedmanniomyces endolithicus]KAK0304581.1 pre-rRNA processing and 40S ribosomal subunit assembly [Friedmanniomyces endolithicus]KAK0826725.1 pre-rRNA processing and 40S ribosomal subunit assembly [Friedmanniomyces endolithicus]